MCDFCERFDFATARLDVRKDTAHIELALCNTRFPKEQQFKYCPVCGANLNENKINYDRIRNMSVEKMARFMAEHIDHYLAPYEVKEIYQNAIDEKTGKGIIWIEAFKRWLESEVTE